MPVPPDRATVVTIHDLQPLDDPANFSPAKRRWLARELPRAVERADVVTTPSRWVADEVVERFGLDPARVIAVSAYASEPDDRVRSAAPSPEREKVPPKPAGVPRWQRLIGTSGWARASATSSGSWCSYSQASKEMTEAMRARR